MTNQNTPNDTQRGALVRAIATDLSRLTKHDPAQLERILQRFPSFQPTIEIVRVWDEQDFAVSNWILMLTGVDRAEELELAKSLLVWKAFAAKDSARVRCIPQSDRNEFRCCCSHFGVVNCPALLVSESPTMESFIKVEPSLLFALSSKPGELERFLTRLHASLESGISIADLGRELNTEHFWYTLKLVYKEVKTFFSISLSASTDIK